MAGGRGEARNQLGFFKTINLWGQFDYSNCFYIILIKVGINLDQSLAGIYIHCLALGVLTNPKRPRPPSMTWQMVTPTSQHFKKLPPDHTHMVLAPKILDIKSSSV